MPTEPQPLTLAQLVHRAAEVTDPDGADEDVVELSQRFEDADWPVSGILEDIDQRMAERSEEHTSELQSRQYLVCRLLLEKKKKHIETSWGM